MIYPEFLSSGNGRRRGNDTYGSHFVPLVWAAGITVNLIFSCPVYLIGTCLAPFTSIAVVLIDSKQTGVWSIKNWLTSAKIIGDSCYVSTPAVLVLFYLWSIFSISLLALDVQLSGYYHLVGEFYAYRKFTLVFVIKTQLSFWPQLVFLCRHLGKDGIYFPRFLTNLDIIISELKTGLVKYLFIDTLLDLMI